MSKRYGRNQKRKHREEIDNLQAAHELDRGLVEWQGKKIREGKDKLSDVLSVIADICPHSVALPAKVVIGNGKRDSYALHKMETFEEMGVVVNDNEPPELIDFSTINLYALRSFVETNRNRIGACVHLEYAAGKHSAYMISEEALLCTPRDMLVKRMLPGVVKDLVRHIRR